jgi:hypothetical protein
MTEVVEVAWIVSGTSVLTIGLNRIFSLMDARAVRAKLDVVETKMDGLLDSRVKAAGDLGHAEGKAAGVNEERDRP